MMTPCAPSVSPRRIRQNGRSTLVRPHIGSVVGFRAGVTDDLVANSRYPLILRLSLWLLQSGSFRRIDDNWMWL